MNNLQLYNYKILNTVAPRYFQTDFPFNIFNKRATISKKEIDIYVKTLLKPGYAGGVEVVGGAKDVDDVSGMPITFYG